MRRVHDESFTISRNEIEEIGAKAGLSKLRAVGEFTRLAVRRGRGTSSPKVGCRSGSIIPLESRCPDGLRSNSTAGGSKLEVCCL